MKKLVKENLNENIEDNTIKKAEEALAEMYHYFLNKVPGGDDVGFGEWLGELMVDLYRGPVHAGYDEMDAQRNLDDFISGWNNVNKEI